MKIQEKPDYLIFANSAKNGESANFPDVSRGWGVTIDQTASKPPMEWMNGAFNRVDKNMMYLLQQGVPEWSETVIYPVNAIIKYNGVLYIAIAENDDAKPSTETGKWATIIDGKYLPAIKISSNCYCVNSHVVIKDMVGDQRLMPFRRDELPFGWYFRNGDNYLLDSPQGRALDSLSANYKEDYKITIKVINGKQYINVPTAFAPDGRGYFERAIDGTTRQVGSAEGDAIRDVWGHFDTGVVPHHDEYTRGAFFGTTAINPTNTAFQSSTSWQTCGFDFYASRVVPTANENRPINIGLTPVIYLGV